MKKFLCALLLMVPLGTYAEHVDVIEVQLKEGCSLSTYLAIAADFNDNWGKQYGYQSEVLAPIQSHNLESLYWVGRSADTGAFGKAFDQWSKALMDPNSVASKLAARFVKCSSNIGRRAYTAH